MSESTIEVQQRVAEGKNANRRLRAAGVIPAVLYGGGGDSVPIQINQHQIDELLRSRAGENTVFLLKLEGTKKSRHSMIRDLQKDSITGHLIHIDFQRILLDQKIKLAVPVEIVGVPEGVKTEGGILDFVTREVEIECLPTQIPNQIRVDVEALHVGQHIEAGQIELPKGIELLTDRERVLVSIAIARVVEEEAEESEELLEAETAQPEVVGGDSEEGAG